MNIQEIIKDYENYKKGLEGDLLKIEGIRQKQKEALLEVKKEHLLFPDKIQKETGLPIEKWENEFDEFCNLSLFPVTCILPLQYIIAHFEYKKGIEFLSIHGVHSSINLLDTSASNIFQILKQLPEHLTLLILDNICSELNVDLLDSYKDGEDSFVNAFDQLNNKSDFINEWLLAMKTIIDSQSVEQLFNIDDENTIEAIKFYFQGIVDDVKNQPKLELTNESCEAFGKDLYETDKNGMLVIDLEDKIEFYKKILLRYLTLSPRFDSFTKKCADKILHHPDYLELNNELLDECRKEKEKGCSIDGNGANGDNSIMPLPFTTSVSIDANNRVSFLTELYDKLVDKRYVDSNKCDDFVFLLGGGSKCPKNLAPIKWLKQKNQLQAFCSVYLNKDTNIEWSTLNSYFTWKGGSPKLSNSCGVIPKNFKTNFLAIFEECKTKILKQD